MRAASGAASCMHLSVLSHLSIRPLSNFRMFEALGRLNFRTLERPSVRTFEHLHVRTFKRPRVQTLELSNVRTFERLNVRSIRIIRTLRSFELSKRSNVSPKRWNVLFHNVGTF